ncbi:MAG: phosphatase PAP2 family protein [Gaiellaceae bacterium]
MLSLDRRAEAWIVAHRTGWLDWLSIGLSRIGSFGAVWIAIAIVLALLWRRPSIVVAVVAADGVSQLLAWLGKTLIHRHRPFVHQLGTAATTHSFPSGHSASSFACAVVLGMLVPRLRWPFVALATLIALSRLYNGDHFPLDVLAGAVLGVATALLLRATIRRRSGRGWRAG